MFIPVLLAFGFMFATPMMMDVAAAPGGNGNGNGNGNNGGNSVPENALLPDITPGVPKHLAIHNQQQQEVLRFTNTWANVGVGALEFEPVFPDPNAPPEETQDALQNLYDDAGNFGNPSEKIWEATVSEFFFHQNHNHWHVDDIGEFTVHSPDVNDPTIPGELATGTSTVKIGFCIADVYKYNGEESPTSQRIYWDCEASLQGIQSGWIDQYHQSVEGNEIDITNLVDGTYFLVHTWNPEGTFVDADVTNNVSWVEFELSQDNDGNGNRKITELTYFAPECQPDGSTPGICGEINKNN